MNSREKPKHSNVWNKNPPKKPAKPPGNGLSTENKFKEAQRKLQASIQKHIKDYESSSEEDELETNTLIEKITEKYKSTAGRDEKLLRTENYLKDVLLVGATTCLICISKVKRDEEVWSCDFCYCLFHLLCIQRWSKDNISQKKQSLEGHAVFNEVSWGCPKCRKDYRADEIPKVYTCFCKKTINPKYQNLLAPHSCGEICRKDLQPPCGHKCLLLCHPGPCPPCPLTVHSKCYCGAQPPRLQRCSDKYWSCGGPCKKLLECGKHYCKEPCHAGDCKICPNKSIQKCMCKSQAKLRDCSTPIWQCDKVCGKILDCGNHKCLDICHAGQCNVCILNLPRSCPCGKTKYQLPCTEETPTCLDTCDKLLECDQHKCVLKCHKDRCSMCLEIVEKKCRCGQHVKQLQCSKPFFCETKCKNMRDCNKHPCNKKCCDGNCPPCEKPCGKTLSCGIHKCASVCHRGQCYPCNLTDTVTCNCGGTKLQVPCGRKYKVKPPKCVLPCHAPPDCHHAAREPHRCHFGNCPPCKQICQRTRENCSHLCPVSCHDAVMVKIQVAKATAPWEEVEPQKEKKRLPCPDCVVPVPVQCLGQHEISNWPCHLAKPSSCFRPCGRLLICGNHNCTLPCHLVTEAPDHVQAGSNCENCESGCTKERPDGCQHDCPKPCHPGVCPPCKQMIKTKCHCSLVQLFVNCRDFLDPNKKNDILTCGNQCPKYYDCGHRCRANCHPGSCPNPESCKKKVKIFCKCKRLKKEFSCETVRKNKAIIDCDEICLQLLEESNKRNAALEEEKKKLEELKNKEEMESYMKKFGKKKSRNRRLQSDDEEESFLKKYYLYLSMVCVLIISIVMFWFVKY